MLLRNGLSFRICCSLLLMPDMYVLVTNLVRCKICMVGFRTVHFSVLFRIFPFSVSALLLSIVFLLMRLALPGLHSFYFSFSYVFCLISSITFFNSSASSFNYLTRNFLSVIAVKCLEISNSSSKIMPKLHSSSISISRLQNSSGVSSSDCFAQKKSLRLR